MTHLSSGLVSCLLLMLLVPGCVPARDDLVCEPGETQLCVCGDDTTGAQTCQSDGSSWTTCECAGDDDDDDDATADDDDNGDDDNDDDDNGDDDDDNDDDDDTSQDAAIADITPMEGATDFYHRNDIRVEFTDVVTTASVHLEGPGAQVVTGTNTLSENDTVLTFDPHGASEADHLEPSTAYTATITWGASSSALLHFSTSAVGTPVANPQATLVGRDFRIDLGSLTFTEPPGVGGLLQGYVSDVNWVLHVDALDDGAHQGELFTGFVDQDGLDYVQDLCCETVALRDGTSWDNPYIQAGPADLELSLQGANTVLLDTILAGSFTQDGMALEGFTLETEMDTRFMDELIDPEADEGAGCDLLASLGISCHACPGGAGDFCLDVAAHSGTAGREVIVGQDPETGLQYNHLVEVTPATASDWVAGGFCEECAAGCSAVAGARPAGRAALPMLVGLVLLALSRGRRR